MVDGNDEDNTNDENGEHDADYIDVDIAEQEKVNNTSDTDMIDVMVIVE